MPLNYYHKIILRLLGQVIGNVLKIYYNTEFALGGKFARIAVEINLNKPLVSQFLLDGRVQRIEYENLTTICFECGIYEHYSTNCTEKVASEVAKNVNKEGKGDDRDTTVLKGQPKTPTESPKFSPWMVWLGVRICEETKERE